MIKFLTVEDNCRVTGSGIHEPTLTPGVGEVCAKCGDSILTTIQLPKPEAGDGVSIIQLVIQDLQERERFGQSKYGTTLQAGNKRDGLFDAYQEALDLCAYLRKELRERYGC